MKFSIQILLLIIGLTIFSCKKDLTDSGQHNLYYKIAFMSENSSGLGSINLIDISGGRKQTLIEPVEQTFFMEWSNDAKSFLYTQALGIPSELYLYNTETQTSKLLYHNNSWPVYDMQFSSDGERIKFTSEHLLTVDINGENLTQITDTSDNLMHSAWFPNEDKIILSSKRNTNYEIYMIDINNNIRTQITNNSSYSHTFISISSDGKKILYILSDPNKYYLDDDTKQLYKLNLENQELTNLGLNSFSDVLGWSPDASKIIFIKKVGATYQIFMMDDDGPNQIQLTKDDKSFWKLKWFPDGSGIIGIYNTDFYFISQSGVKKIIINDDDVQNILAYAISPKKMN